MQYWQRGRKMFHFFVANKNKATRERLMLEINYLVSKLFWKLFVRPGAFWNWKWELPCVTGLWFHHWQSYNNFSAANRFCITIKNFRTCHNLSLHGGGGCVCVCVSVGIYRWYVPEAFLLTSNALIITSSQSRLWRKENHFTCSVANATVTYF